MARWRRYGAAALLVHAGVAILGGFPALASPARPLVWALGDSITAGLGLPPAQSFPSQLEAALRKGGIAATVNNGGISGDTTAQGKARLRWGLRGLGTVPDLVIVELGGNDMLRGLPPAASAANLDAILAELERRHIPTLVMGMKAAPNLGSDYRTAFDGFYPRVAKAHGARLYPFFLDGVAGNRALFQADGIHPNARGVQIVVGRVLPVVKAALQR